MLTTLGWEIAAKVRGGVGDPEYFFGLPTVYPALALSIGTLVVVSLATKAPRAEELRALR